MDEQLYIGVMSGTSMDGVDCALVAIDGQKIRLLHHIDYPIPEQLKQRLLAMNTGQSTNLVDIGEVDHWLGHLFADAVNALLQKSGYQPGQITAIGNHGQTVYHQPAGKSPFTMQLGDANIIAVKTGIDTVADFRRKDMALGGQGAPLVPAFHKTLFACDDTCVVVLNIGGIANISVLRPDAPVVGYDTGPGNMLMDIWVKQHKGSSFDANAEFAQSGQIHAPLLERLLAEPYLHQPYPKSTGRELFNLSWLERQLSGLSYTPADVQRTLCEYTAQSIAHEVTRFGAEATPRLYVCGGGAKNPLLMQRLTQLLPKWQVALTSSAGIDDDYMEAMAFAWLAYRRMHNLPSNLPEVTGASKAVPLGVIYLADN